MRATTTKRSNQRGTGMQGYQASLTALGILLLLVHGGHAAADAEDNVSAADSGRTLYEQYCATCHGLDGRGSGDFANLLTVAPPDLTAIAERRGGSFSATEIARIIDGRETPRAHGSAEMPVWGERLGEPERAGREGDAAPSGEIFLIVQYLRSIQAGEVQDEPPEKSGKRVAQVGEGEYMRNCASCHGVTGRGEGEVGSLLAQPPPNLRTLAARNGGTFPTLRVARAIDGREGVIAHGSREMPVWGRRLRGLGGSNRRSAIRGEIMLYVAYLRSIQDL